MNIYKVLPDLGNERRLRLWHKALRSQWSAEDIGRHKPQRRHLTFGQKVAAREVERIGLEAAARA